MCLLMKAVKADFHYESIYWTDEKTTLNEFTENNILFNGKSAKFDAFNTLPVRELIFQCKNECYTHVRIPTTIPIKPLVEYFKLCEHNQCSIVLEFLGGMEHPLYLALGQTIANSSVEEVKPSWRIHAKDNVNKNEIFGARIGGFFTKESKTYYAKDSLGNNCSSEVAGFGITDKLFPPFDNARKSFGVRQGKNATTVGNQMSIECHIYAVIE